MFSLVLSNICVTANDQPVVTDVSCTLSGGQVAVLMGPNGSGKSSLVNALMGHPQYRTSAGSVQLDGEDITALPVFEKARKGLFLSLQHTPKVGGVTLATFLHKAYTAQSGAQTDVLEYYLALREKAQAYGLRDDLLDRPLSEGLSGGEKKLADLLQLIALKPRFALLDEIDSGVDVDALKVVFKTLKRLADEGMGFLVVSHHPALLSHLTPHAVYLMAGGRLVRSGGVELAEEIYRDGFCKAVECPLSDNCSAADRKDSGN